MHVGDDGDEYVSRALSKRAGIVEAREWRETEDHPISLEPNRVVARSRLRRVLPLQGDRVALLGE